MKLQQRRDDEAAQQRQRQRDERVQRELGEPTKLKLVVVWLSQEEEAMPCVPEAQQQLRQKSMKLSD